MSQIDESILIAIEGIDGAGKTTQVQLLKSALENAGQEVITSKEPTTGKWGRIIRDTASTGRLSVENELELFIKDRSEHIDSLVNPAREAGKIVILDRYFYSTIAYQGCRGMNPADVETDMKARFPTPDAVFLLDLDPVVSTYRIAHSRGEEPNHFEDRDNLAKARSIFNALTGAEVHRIDGTMSQELVHERIIDLFIDGPLSVKRCAKAYGCQHLMDCSYRILGNCNWFKIAKSLRDQINSSRTVRT